MTPNWLEWLKVLSPILVSGLWPLTVAFLGWLLREPLTRLLDRVKSAEGAGLRLDIGVQERGERPLLAASEQEASSNARALPEAGSDASKTPVEKSESSTPASGEPWRRCGNVYWLGNNTIFAALAIAIGNIDAARSEFENARHHARQLPLPSDLIDELDNIARENWSDPSNRQTLVNRLILVGSLIGRFIAHKQPDFPRLDIRAR